MLRRLEANFPLAVAPTSTALAVPDPNFNTGAALKLEIDEAAFWHDNDQS